MAFGLLGNAIAIGGGGAVSLPAQNTVGAKLIVLAVTTASASGVPTDSLGNTWLQGAPYVASPASNSTALFYCINPITGPAHTFSYPSGVSAIAASWWSATGPIKDKQSSSGTSTPGSVTPAAAGALLVTACSAGGGGGTIANAIDSGFTILNAGANNASAFGLSHAYLIQATAAPVSPTWTGTASGFASSLLSFTDIPPFAAVSTIAISTTAALSGSTLLAATPTIAFASVGDFTPPGLWATSSIRFAVTTALRSTPILRATPGISLSTVMTAVPAIDVLIVAGGGGAGRGGVNVRGAGGGGAGGAYVSAIRFDALTPGEFPIVVGAGGVAATSTTVKGSNGGDSSAFGVTTAGGGGASSGDGGGNGNNGGCGGGAGDNAGLAAIGGTGTAGGAGGSNATTGGSGGSGGGGGGMNPQVGQNGVLQGTGIRNGGGGFYSGISGAATSYCNGGCGGAYNGANTAVHGAVNTGNGGWGGTGGGGGSGNVGGNGGSGIVIFSYVTTTLPVGYVTTGGTITTVGTRTIHTFLNSGTFYVGPPIATGRTLIHLHRLPRRTRMLPAAAIALVAVLGATACASRGGVTLHLAPTNLICPDRIPAKLFLDPRCPNGVCGYTCAPNRWRNWLTRQLTGDLNHDETP